MKILIISTCKEKLHELEFVKPIEKILLKNEIQFSTINYKNFSQDNLNNYDKIIIPGTSLKDFEYLHSGDKFEWIKNINQPILGICAGMHIVGFVFGAKPKFNQEIGLKEVKLKSDFFNLPKSFEAYFVHNMSLKELHNFEILGKTDIDNAIIKHKSKEIYGISFHPEVKNPELIKNFCKF
ncbi:MAG: glutamine amidotransferase class-I [archaeon GW2011_AR13]|nr:MAG: glutamine amidotransferase class-I [archaeon GW2011_AR13]HIG95113.1 hypothetical protein [Nanoarchaeota archaeon]HIH63195.1 hypothetical protein [Nanoarchaeota archaeon]HIJ09299.1 hypothetical protein [Nanoarchaeota archaeon]